jgi:multidrug efflux pump subunit AcrA (membrane-fusion protein)
MASKSIKWLLGLALLAGGAWLFYQKVYLPKSTYESVVAKKGDLNLTVFGIATVGSKERFPVSSNYGGKLLEVRKDQGEWAEKGEVIARLDPVDLPQQLAEAKARRESAHYGVIAAQKQIESLRAQLRLARINYERYAKLQKQGYAAKAEYDKALTDLESLRAQIAASEAQIRSQQAQKRQAEQNIRALQARLERLTITAPVAGYVTSRDAQPSQTIAPQQPIVTLVQPKNVWVRATIDERISGGIEVGQPATIRLRSHADSPMKGRVARIEAVSDPVTEERIVDVAFDKVPIPFYLNEQAEVRIVTGTLHDVVLVPTALLRKGKVWIARDGKAHAVKVRLLGESGRWSAVEGVPAGARILKPDPHKKPLFEGASVRL